MLGGRFTLDMGEAVQGSRKCILYLVLLEWCLSGVCVVLDPTVNSADRDAHGILPLVLGWVLCACIDLSSPRKKRDGSGFSSHELQPLRDVCCTYGMTICLLLSFIASAQVLAMLLFVDVLVSFGSGFSFVYHFFTLFYLSTSTDRQYSNHLVLKELLDYTLWYFFFPETLDIEVYFVQQCVF